MRRRCKLLTEVSQSRELPVLSCLQIRRTGARRATPAGQLAVVQALGTPWHRTFLVSCQRTFLPDMVVKVS